jgi:hypothetical protein
MIQEKQQHEKITGYRTLTETEIAQINSIKDFGNKLGNLILEIEASEKTDKRFVAIAKTDIQKGFMMLIRSVAKPETFV